MITFWLVGSVSLAQGFKFSNDDNADKARELETQARAGAAGQPRKAKIKNQKILVLIADSTNGLLQTAQSRYGGHFDASTPALQALGLKTFTQEQIKRANCSRPRSTLTSRTTRRRWRPKSTHSTSCAGSFPARRLYNTIARVNQVSARCSSR